MLNGDGNGKRSIGTVKRATKNVHFFFATLLQNELNSDVAHFTTLQQIGLNVGGKTLNIANELVFHQCWKTSCKFFFIIIIIITVASGQLPQKNTFHVQHTFLYISLPLFCTTTGRNLVIRFIEELSYVFLFA